MRSLREACLWHPCLEMNYREIDCHKREKIVEIDYRPVFPRTPPNKESCRLGGFWSHRPCRLFRSWGFSETREAEIRPTSSWRVRLLGRLGVQEAERACPSAGSKLCIQSRYVEKGEGKPILLSSHWDRNWCTEVRGGEVWRVGFLGGLF